MTPDVLERLVWLGATPAGLAPSVERPRGLRCAQLATFLDEAFPGCLLDGDALPAEEPWLRSVVLVALQGTGRFDDAILFAQRLPPATPVGGESPAQVVARLVEVKRVLAGSMHTVLNQQGEVVTVLAEGLHQEGGGFSIHYRMDGTRVDQKLCLFALERMRRRLRERFGARPGRVEVEIHDDRGRFRASYEAAVQQPLPAGVSGLASPETRQILVLHDPLREGTWELVVALSHEYVHLAMRSLAREGRIPRWLDEGLAVSLTQELPRELLELWARARGVGLRLADMEGEFRGTARMQDLAYARAALAAQRILGEPNGDQVLLRGLREGWSTIRWEAETRLHGVC